MQCDEFGQHLDDYVDAELKAADMHACKAHFDTCKHCQCSVDSAQSLRSRLSAYGAATARQPHPDFFARSLAKAAQSGGLKQRNRWLMTGFGSAIAATLMLWIVSNVFFASADLDRSAIPTVSMELEAPQTFNLVFSSAAALQNASMTVTLPPGIELDGFAGQREITWKTSLNEGRNVLPLTLVATTPVGGELLATLQHENSDKMFRLQVSVI